MYHSWNDQLIAPRNSINYYTSVAKALGTPRAAAARGTPLGGPDKISDSIRLFMCRA